MNTVEELETAIEGWDGMGDPPGLATIRNSPAYQSLPPGDRMRAINGAQRNWAGRMLADDPETYGDNVRGLEVDFGRVRREELAQGLKEDLASGKLNKDQVARYIQNGSAGFANEPETLGYLQDRYGEDQDQNGPWVTAQVEMPGGGFAYVRHEVDVDPANPEKDKAEVSWSLYGREGRFSGTEDVRLSEPLQSARKSRQMVERHMEEQAQAMAVPELDYRPPGPGEEIEQEAALLDLPPQQLPLALAQRAVAQSLRKRPEVVEKIGQSGWKAAGAEALKGALTVGTAAGYGPQALLGDKDAAREYSERLYNIETGIEGMSQAQFEGGFVNEALTAVARETVPLVLSAGTGAAASGLRNAISSSVGKNFIKRMVTAEMAEAPFVATAAGVRSSSVREASEIFARELAGEAVPALTEAQAFHMALARGTLGKALGTGQLESKGMRMLADRVVNAAAFLPSSARTGLDNIMLTLNEAEKLREQAKALEAQGNTAAAAKKRAEADQLEERAILSGWMGLGIETLSENIWINELAVTRAGRSLGRVAEDVLAKKLGKKGWAELQERAVKFLKDVPIQGGKEAIEEVVAGGSNRAYVNEFANQNQDIFKGMGVEAAVGFALGGMMSGAHALRSSKPEILATLMERGLKKKAEHAKMLDEIYEGARVMRQRGTGAAPAGVPQRGAAPAGVPQGQLTPQEGEVTRLAGIAAGRQAPAQAPAQVPVVAAAPGTPQAPPMPDPAETVAEQVRLAEDPQSTRAAVLFTPGTPIPPRPYSLDVVDDPAEAPHGPVWFNPQKTTREDVIAAGAGPVFDGTLLGMSGQPPGVGDQVVEASTPGAPGVQSEVVSANGDVQAAVNAAQQAAPGAQVQVKSPAEVAAEAMRGAQMQRVGRQPLAPTAVAPAAAPQVTAKDAEGAVRILRSVAPDIVKKVTIRANEPGAPSTREGYFDPATGQSVVLLDNVRPRKGETRIGAIMRVIVHERVGHEGIQMLLDTVPDFRAKWEGFIAGIPSQELAALLPRYPNYRQDHADDAVNAQRRAKLAWEWFAHQAEKMDLSKAPPNSLLGRMWAAVRDAVARLFAGTKRPAGTTLNDQTQEFIKMSMGALAAQPAGPAAAPGEAVAETMESAALPPRLQGKQPVETPVATALVIPRLEDTWTGHSAKTAFTNRKRAENDVVIKGPYNRFTPSRLSPPRVNIYNTGFSMPAGLKGITNEAGLRKLIIEQTDNMRSWSENQPDLAAMSLKFYSGMADASWELAATDLDLADLYLRWFAFLSPRSTVIANAAKGVGAGVAAQATGFTPGLKAGTGAQVFGMDTIRQEWMKGEHFGMQLEGVDNKVRNFYLNGASELLEKAIREQKPEEEILALAKKLAASLHYSLKTSGGVEVKVNQIDDIPELQKELHRLVTSDMWDQAALGNVRAGFVIAGDRSNHKWVLPGKQKTVSVWSKEGQAVLNWHILKGENKLKGRAGTAPELWPGRAALWDNLTKQELDSLDFNHRDNTISVFTEKDLGEQALAAGGEGAVYDVSQALSGIMADVINASGGMAGKPAWTAYNVQEFRWGMVKVNNPLPDQRDFSSYDNVVSMVQDITKVAEDGSLREKALTALREKLLTTKAAASRAAMERQIDAISRFPFNSSTPQETIKEALTAAGMEDLHRGTGTVAAAETAYGIQARTIMPFELISQEGGAFYKAKIDGILRDLRNMGSNNPEQDLTRHVAGPGFMEGFQQVIYDAGLPTRIRMADTALGSYMATFSPIINVEMSGPRWANSMLNEAVTVGLEQTGGNLFRDPTLSEKLTNYPLTTVLEIPLPAGHTDAQVMQVMTELGKLTDSQGRSSADFIGGHTTIVDDAGLPVIAIHGGFYKGGTFGLELDRVMPSIESITRRVLGTIPQATQRVIEAYENDPKTHYRATAAGESSRGADQPASPEELGPEDSPQNRARRQVGQRFRDYIIERGESIVAGREQGKPVAQQAPVLGDVLDDVAQAWDAHTDALAKTKPATPRQLSPDLKTRLGGIKVAKAALTELSGMAMGEGLEDRAQRGRAAMVWDIAIRAQRKDVGSVEIMREADPVKLQDDSQAVITGIANKFDREAAAAMAAHQKKLAQWEKRKTPKSGKKGSPPKAPLPAWGVVINGGAAVTAPPGYTIVNVGTQPVLVNNARAEAEMGTSWQTKFQTKQAGKSPPVRQSVETAVPTADALGYATTKTLSGRTAAVEAITEENGLRLEGKPLPVATPSPGAGMAPPGPPGGTLAEEEDDGKMESVAGGIVESVAMPPEGVSAALAAGSPVLTSNALVVPPGTDVMESIAAHHGSPHEVKPRFSLSRIGTGEGTQAFGWGLYFAQLLKTAQAYMGLGPAAIRIDGTKLSDMSEFKLLRSADRAEVEDILREEIAAGKSPLQIADEISGKALRESVRMRGPYRAIYDLMVAANTATVGKGNLYNVTLDVEEDELLDWDKPLSEQSEKVRTALKDHQFSVPEGKTRDEMSGVYIYRMATGDAADTAGVEGAAKAASEALLALGIPGIRFMDAGSRSRGTFIVTGTEGRYMVESDGKRHRVGAFATRAQAEQRAAELNSEPKTSNYVMFDDSKIAITHENGEAVLFPDMDMMESSAAPAGNDVMESKAWPLEARDWQSAPLLPQFLKDKLGARAVAPYEVSNQMTRAMLTGSALPREPAKMAARTQEEVKGVMFAGAMRARDLQTAMKAYQRRSGRTERDVGLTVNSAMEDPAAMAALANVDPVLHERAVSARNYIDTLSHAVAATTGGTLGQAIMQNAGHWLRTDYAVFDKSTNWNNKTLRNAAAQGKKVMGRDAKTVLDNARKYLERIHPGQSPAGIDAMITEMLDRDNWHSVGLGMSRPDGLKVSREVTSLMARKTLDPAVKELMGEVKDPIKRIGRSVGIQAQLIAHHDLQVAMLDHGLRAGLFSLQKDGTYTVPLGGSDVADNQRWNGFTYHDPVTNESKPVYTTPAMWAALQAMPMPGAKDLGNLFLSAFKALGGEAKMNNVALNPDSWAVNLIGSMIGLLQSGDLYTWRGLLRIYEAAGIHGSAGAKSGRKVDKTAEALMEQKRAILSQLVAGGVAGASFDMADIEANLDNGIAAMIEGSPVANIAAGATRGAITGQSFGAALGAGGRVVGGVAGAAVGGIVGGTAITKVQKFIAEKMIASPDNIAKISVYLGNWATHIAAGMTPQKAHALAVQKTRMTMPDYSALPFLAKEASKLGLLGSFIAFQHQLYSNYYWNIRIAVQELATPNMAMRGRGLRRLMGSATVTALGGGLIAMLTGAAKGTGDDDKDKAYRRSLGAPWERWSQLAYNKLDGEEASFFNTSYLVPQTTLFELKKAAFEGKSLEEGLQNALAAGYRQFAEGSVHADPLLEAVMNQKKGDRGPVSTETGLRQVQERLQHFMRVALEPAAAKKAERIGHAVRGEEIYGRTFSTGEEVLRLLGVRQGTYKHEDRMAKRITQIKKEYDNARFDATNKWKAHPQPADRAAIIARANERIAGAEQQWLQFKEDMATLEIRGGLVRKVREDKDLDTRFKRLKAGTDGPIRTLKKD